MSFTASSKGTTFEAGFFLADDGQCLRDTYTIAADHSQRVVRNGRTVVPAGAVIPANDASAVGILYEDIDVTDGAAPGPVVTKGVVYGDLLPLGLEDAAASALAGIIVRTSPGVTRPDFGGAAGGESGGGSGSGGTGTSGGSGDGGSGQGGQGGSGGSGDPDDGYASDEDIDNLFGGN